MNALPPFDTRTPFLEKGGDVHEQRVRWFKNLGRIVNASPQVTSVIPASSAAPGSKGQVVYDGLDKYEHNGTQWIKFTGVTF